MQKTGVRQKDAALDASADQLKRQKEYASRLEEEKSRLREDFSAERDRMQAEIDTAYVTIGKLYVDKLLAGAEITDFGAGPTLKLIEPKIEKKMELEKELLALEKALADSQILQERQIVQNEIDEIKAKLDKAKAMGAITDADYNERLAKAGKKLEHFDEIRMLKKQKDLGLLSSAEFDEKVNALLA